VITLAESVLDHFRPFGLLHAAAASVATLLTLCLCAAGRRATYRRDEPLVRAGWIGASVVIQAANIIYYVIPPNLDLSESLPLHVCDLAGPLAIAALWTQSRPWRALLYFWGIGLCTQAYFTPVLEEPWGLGTLRFWLFFGTHFQIIASALYDLIVLRFRPTWGDFVRGVCMSVAYVLAMVLLDAATGWNYGYVGPTRPNNPTIIDHLGPYPWRVVYLSIIVTFAFAALTLPWRLLARRGTAPPAAG